MKFKKYHESKNLFNLSAYSSAALTNCAIAVIDDILTQTNSGKLARSAWKIDDLQVGADYTMSVTINNPDETECQIRIYDSANSTVIIASTASKATSITLYATFTAQTTTHYVRLYSNTSTTTANTYSVEFSEIMLNSGSEALPYEPYSSEVWHDTPYYIHKTDTDTFTTLPAVLYPTGTTATVGLKGQAVQSSTPSPTSPVMPQGTGERTGNLFDYTITQGSFAIETGNEQSSPYRVRTNMPDFKLPAGTYTINVDGADDIVIYCYDDNGYVQSASFTGWAPTPRTFTLSSSLYVRFAFRFGNNATISPSNINYVMLNTGSTALPYEPYGFEISISSAGQTTPVYLGEVQTTREIRKRVLTGEEDWIQAVSSLKVYRINIPGYLREMVNTPICTHYKGIAPVIGTEGLKDLETAFLLSSSGNNYYYIRDDRFNNANDFKSYLQQQYSAGTPVIVWYVLAAEKTGIVNEPLMKIGDYADTVSNITIPVTAGTNTLSVGTTVQPSEVTVNYKGWHPVQNVHEKSKNLFDKDNTTPVSLYYQEQREIIATNQYVVSIIIPVSPNTTYTFNNSTGNRNRICETETIPEMNDTVINYISSDNNASITLTTSNDTHYILWWVGYQQAYSDIADTLSVNLGSEALPYEPYWK